MEKFNQLWYNRNNVYFSEEKALKIDFCTKKIANGISLNIVKDAKFNTNIAVVQFISSFTPDDASARAFMPNLLTVHCKKYPTRAQLNKKLMSLYNASLNVSTSVVGDKYVTSISISCINDKHAYDGEKVTAEAVKLMLECIFDPVVENGRFDDKEFEILKQDLLDTIDSEINNKRGYASMLANSVIFEGEPSSVWYYGTRETAEALTNEQVYDCYVNTLKNSVIKLTVGGNEIDEAADILEKAFSNMPRKTDETVSFYGKSPCKQTVRYETFESDVAQTRLVMAYKGGSGNIYVDKLFCSMFGATPTSRLFMNVREKLQLCYSCSSYLREYKGALLVDAGIDRNNCEKAMDEINRQLELLANGDFSDEELYQTKLMITGAFRSNYDSLAALCVWYEVQQRRNTCYTPDEVIEIFMGITREDIMNCAKSYKPDTVFMLIPEDRQKGN